MKQLIIEITESGGKVKTAIRDGAILNPTPIESGIHNYLGDQIQQLVDRMFDEAEAEAAPRPITLTPSPGETLSNGWKKIDDELPDLGKLVWLYEPGSRIWIGDRSMINAETWVWTYCDGQPYYTCNNTYDGDCLADDDYRPTMWHELPECPAQKGGLPSEALAKGGAE